MMAYSLLPYFLISSCFFLPLLTTAQTTNNNITLGSSLTAGNQSSQSWLSPSKHFAFGFKEVQPPSGNYLLAIWFDSIPVKTVTWSANRDKLVPTGSKLLFTDGTLVLNNPTGIEIWRADLNGIVDILAYGAMLDSGNFVLASRTGNNLWESFSQPTDTLLSTQTLKPGNPPLVASHTNTNYSSGRFMLQFKTNGTLALFTTNKYPVINSVNAEYDSIPTDESGSELQFNTSGYLNLVAKNGTTLREVFSDTVSEQNFYQRVTFDYDGVLRHYVYPKNNSSAWAMRSSLPDNICRTDIQEAGSGICGYNSYCTLGNLKGPNCTCPPGYTYLDPSNKLGGCVQNFAPHNCLKPSHEISYQFHVEELENVDWPYSDYEHYVNVTKDLCRNICLPDCFCAVSVFQDTRGGECWKKKLPLTNGRSGNFVGRTSFIKVGSGSPVDSNNEIGHHKSSNKLWLVLFGITGVGSVILLAVICFGSFSFVSYRRVKQGVKGIKLDTRYSIRSFSYEELHEVTNGFEEEIGTGAFAVVYKGIITGVLGTPIFVAVKKLGKNLRDHDREFKAEVDAIGHTHHKNLVQLIGFCNEGEHRLLVYEYMANGTLFDYVYKDPKPAWDERLRIAQGIAQGILYLHEECSRQIIHCDIKPQNILLDDDHNARISDFGLAKLLGFDQTQTNTMVRGTRGYVAPEWFKNKPITAKVDVYSFGTLLLEVICCRKNLNAGENQGNKGSFFLLTDMAFDCCQERRIDALIEDDDGAQKDLETFERIVKISLWCIQDDPNLRPTMRRVVQMVEGVVQVPQPPCPTPYSPMFSA